MKEMVDLLIVGAGPAGMSAAIAARAHGLDVLVVDEQAEPGGQIWRNVEAASAANRAASLGHAYEEGAGVVRKFRASGAAYEPATRAWQFEQDPASGFARAFVTQGGQAFSVHARCLLLATGAQERPMPFPGWTLPGVMTVGAAQILLKSAAQIPAGPVWIAGNGPLSLLYAVQLLDAGGRIAGFLETRPRANPAGLVPSLLRAAAHAPGDLVKGLRWLYRVRRSVPFVSHVTQIEAVGDGRLESLRYRTGRGVERTVEAGTLLVHEGVIPSIHATLSLGCDHEWIGDQDSFAPRLDSWGETSQRNIFVAGDGAGIAGAKAACLRGEIAALGMAARTGHLSADKATRLASPLRSALKTQLAPRPFLDRLYRPADAIFNPDDRAIACRCEDVTVAAIRAEARRNHLEPNQIKALTRAGMGPCQGRQCSYTIAHLLARTGNAKPDDIGLYRVRPPLKPLTMNELASLGANELKS